MSKDNFEALKGSIEALLPTETQIPNMPVDVFLQEASDLQEWSRTDQEKLIAVGVDQALFDGLEARIGALRYAQSAWNKARYTKEQAQQEWDETSPKAYDLKNQMEHAFRFAFRKRTDLLKKVQSVEEGSGHADLVQDLSDLSALGMANLPMLQAINFEEDKLNQAASQASDLNILLAKSNGERREDNQPKITRDKAYSYLKQAVDEIREAGKYIFWKDEVRKKGYTSKYHNR
ncbi:hypothetical protein JKA74_05995 [Marivirga sp. S37H4]|uniref:Uncharacterized protein n=1 Tax=Marivirga aurantiaca TaxID=2802615 RepID=A0A934WWW1_9BACT|nr:hypothetical protein [Marivirga aurantiaca]MBK6264584.1 hypothetical protein [Marivirga aurantiaca]